MNIGFCNTNPKRYRMCKTSRIDGDQDCRQLTDYGSDVTELLGDDRLFTALAAGCHVENAAKVAGISERTAYRRLADPEFRSRLNAARESLRESILARLADAGHDAIGTLFELLNCDDDNVRLKAAKTLIDSLTAVHSMMPKATTTVRRTVEIIESRQISLVP